MTDTFTQRLASVRKRFVQTLECKVEDGYAAMPNLSGETPATAAAVQSTYRNIHNLVGAGPTVGFVATGRTARNVENTLYLAYRDSRGLKAEELDAFTKALHGLREAARRELQTFYSLGE